MKLSAGLLLAMLPVCALAQTQDKALLQPDTGQPLTAPAQPVPPPPADIWLARPVADLQGLDKIVARVTPLSIKTGQSASFGSLTITVRACLVRPPDQAVDAAVYLDIVDANPAAPQFHGWMIVSAPSVSMLEHPVYDIRPLGCHA